MKFPVTKEQRRNGAMLREAAKKVLLLMSGPLRGGGGGWGVKGRPLRKIEFLFEFFFKFCCHLKIKLFYFRQLIEK